MASKVIPFPGDPVPDGAPSIEKIIKVTYGATLGDVQYGTDNAVKTLVTAGPYSIISDVGWQVEVAFTGGADLSIGDTDDVDGWAEVADVGCTVADTSIVWASALAAQGGTDAGSTYPAFGGSNRKAGSSDIVLEITHANTAPTAGHLAVYVKYHMADAQVSTNST